MHWKKTFGIGLGLLGLAVLAKGYLNSKSPALSAETIVIPELPESFEGFRLLFLTDLHFRPWSTLIASVLTRIHEMQPDLVCLGGDYTLGARSLSSVDEFFHCLGSMVPAVGIYGNTDYRLDIPRKARKHWAEEIPFLKNSAMPITHDGQTLWVAGVNDPHLGFDRPAVALRDVPPGVPVILLAHSPEVIRHRLDPRIRLVLCGHTHGGQICLPGGRAIYRNMSLPAELASGRHPARARRALRESRSRFHPYPAALQLPAGNHFVYPDPSAGRGSLTECQRIVQHKDTKSQMSLAKQSLL